MSSDQTSKAYKFYIPNYNTNEVSADNNTDKWAVIIPSPTIIPQSST